MKVHDKKEKDDDIFFVNSKEKIDKNANVNKNVFFIYFILEKFHWK